MMNTGVSRTCSGDSPLVIWLSAAMQFSLVEG